MKIHQDVRVLEAATKAPGGLVRATVRLREGRIDDLVFSGDFTLTPAFALGALEQSLRGVSVTRETLLGRLGEVYGALNVQSPGLGPDNFADAVLAAGEAA